MPNSVGSSHASGSTLTAVSAQHAHETLDRDSRTSTLAAPPPVPYTPSRDPFFPNPTPRSTRQALAVVETLIPPQAVTSSEVYSLSAVAQSGLQTVYNYSTLQNADFAARCGALAVVAWKSVLSIKQALNEQQPLKLLGVYQQELEDTETLIFKLEKQLALHSKDLPSDLTASGSSSVLSSRTTGPVKTLDHLKETCNT